MAAMEKKIAESGTNVSSEPSIHEGLTADAAAAAGTVATDVHGNSLITFDKEAEARLRTKIDWYVVPYITLIYLFCFIDRANIGNARLAGLERDLNLTGYDYNMILSMFYVSYILFEIPSNIACKMMGPGWFIPIISIGFGAVSIATAFVHTRAQICAVRFILGIFEAGMMPGTAYYLSRWYRRSELVFRLSWYIAMGSFGGAFGGLLASGILTLDNFGSLHRWRMIFAIEGIITVAIAALGLAIMTDRPETARWLTPEEKQLAVARVKSERVGVTQNLDRVNKKRTWLGMVSPVTISTAFIFLLTNITVQGLAFFLPTIVRTIYPNVTTVRQQLMTVPPYIVGTLSTILVALWAWKIDRRNVFIMGSAPFVMTGYIMFLASTNPKVRYAATFLITLAAFNNGTLTNAQVTANLLSDTARSSGIGLNVMLGNIGGLISTWAFLPFDGPNYPIGNGLNLATSSTILVISGLLYLWMVRDNKRRDRVDADAALAGMNSEEIEDLVWKHPGFRWQT